MSTHWLLVHTSPLRRCCPDPFYRGSPNPRCRAALALPLLRLFTWRRGDPQSTCAPRSSPVLPPLPGAGHAHSRFPVESPRLRKAPGQAGWHFRWDWASASPRRLHPRCSLSRVCHAGTYCCLWVAGGATGMQLCWGLMCVSFGGTELRASCAQIGLCLLIGCPCHRCWLRCSEGSALGSPWQPPGTCPHCPRVGDTARPPPRL